MRIEPVIKGWMILDTTDKGFDQDVAVSDHEGWDTTDAGP